MPIYNTQEEHLREAIESILNQTFKDFEFLILNETPKRFQRDKGNTRRIYPIFTSYAVRNSRSLMRRQKIKRFVIRALTALIPTKKWRKIAQRKMDRHTEITW